MNAFIKPAQPMRLLKLIICLLVITAANTPPTLLADGDTGTLEHIVVVWLKEPGNLEHRDRIIAESEVLKDIPGVLSLKSGQVVASERSIVDSSFDVALIISFPDQAAMDTYLAHPVHKKLVNETLKPLVEKILVYDFF